MVQGLKYLRLLQSLSLFFFFILIQDNLLRDVHFVSQLALDKTGGA